MQPISATLRAVDDYGPFDNGEVDLLDQLAARARRVQELVPDCVAISLSSNEHGVTFTLVASDDDIAALGRILQDAGGPSLALVGAERVVDLSDGDVLDEATWQVFACATAAPSVASTLTLPIGDAGRIGGSVNLYAASPHAFADHHQSLALIFKAWVPGAVVNADLSFDTRGLAEQAPRLLWEQIRVQIALGIIVNQQHVSLEVAQERVAELAQRAAATEVQIAEMLIATSLQGGGPPDK